MVYLSKKFGSLQYFDLRLLCYLSAESFLNSIKILKNIIAFNGIDCEKLNSFHFIIKPAILSSPEPSGSQGELIVKPCSDVRPSVLRTQFSEIFFETNQSKPNFKRSLLGKGKPKFIRGAIQNYVDFCCRIFTLQPITSYFSQNED